MKLLYKRIYFTDLPEEVRAYHFNFKLRTAYIKGWRSFSLWDGVYIVNRHDEWYVAREYL